MVNWPQSLVIELAARRCIIFLGAGASASATRADGNNPRQHPPTWAKLLGTLHASSNTGDAADRDQAHDLLDKKQYLESAEILRSSCILPADYNRIIAETFSRYRPTEVHKAIERLDQKIVVTTNFDSLYEDNCRQGDATHGYVVLNYYDLGLINRMRSPTRIIIKAHGCVTMPEKTVLSKSDFFKARADHPEFYRTLESVFLTHTLLFIGYSISDPDIQLLLENSTITARSEHPHYALMAQGLHQAIRSAFLRTYTIQILEYDPANNHEEFLTALEDLAEQVEAKRNEQPQG